MRESEIAASIVHERGKICPPFEFEFAAGAYVCRDRVVTRAHILEQHDKRNKMNPGACMTMKNSTTVGVIVYSLEILNVGTIT